MQPRRRHPADRAAEPCYPCLRALAREGHMATIARRELLAALAGAAAWPLAARAQQPMPVVGFLGAASAAGDAFRVAPFRRGLEDAGYVEGQNLAIEYRHARDRYDRLGELAADLVRRQVSVLAAAGGPSALAAKAATTTIPIVFSIGLDPIEAGLVTNLNRPGGNLTGATDLEEELEPKRLEVLHQLMPKESVIAVLANPTHPRAEPKRQGVERAARSVPMLSSTLTASSSLPWQPATPCQQSFSTANSWRPAV